MKQETLSHSYRVIHLEDSLNASKDSFTTPNYDASIGILMAVVAVKGKLIVLKPSNRLNVLN